MEPKHKILVVEDEASQRLLYSFYPHFRDDFMSWMADAYLTKSKDLTELKETIKNLLERNKRGVKSMREGVKRDENVKRKKT